MDGMYTLSGFLVGLIVGVNMLFGGASLIGTALAAHADMP